MQGRGIYSTVVKNTIRFSKPGHQRNGNLRHYNPINNVSVILNKEDDMEIGLTTIDGEANLKKTVKYDNQGEHGYLLTEPDSIIKEPVAELTIFDDVSLTVGVESGTVYRIGGLTSMSQWKRSNIDEPVTQDGVALVGVSNFSKDSGIGHDTRLINFEGAYDEKRKMYTVGAESQPDKIVRIFSNLAIGLKNGKLNDVYIFDIA